MTLDDEYIAQGYRMIAGADEAGRGAWAGPLVAAAVIMPLPSVKQRIAGITDSKKLTERKREHLFPQVVADALCWTVVSMSPADIEKVGLQKANLAALSYALSELYHTPEIGLVDGFAINNPDMPTKKVIKGDQRSYTIAAASIIAKVVRDRLMRRVDRVDERYKFATHKGYGTAAHQARLERHGVSAMHRTSYAPIKRLLQKWYTTFMPYNTVIIDAPGMVRLAGVQPGMKVADLGTGREGRMAMASANVMGNTGVSYAVDVVKNILPTVANKANLHRLHAVKTVWSDLEHYGATREIADNTLDVGFLVTTLFMSQKPADIMRESVRMMKPGGRLVVADWHPQAATSMGPKVARRLHPDTVKTMAADLNLQLANEFSAGQYHWGLMFVC